LVQLVELGAKTVAYKKSKQGGKLAMKDIAEQQGLPSFLVQLRHQAVHESQSITFEIMRTALNRLQGFLFASYWHPTFVRLIKRNDQIMTLRQQLVSYRFQSSAPNIDYILNDPKLSEKQSRSELRTILNKYTKNNVKLSIPLDMNQLVDVIKMFVDCSLKMIHVKFVDLKALTS
jgi:hypothetical protein